KATLPALPGAPLAALACVLKVENTFVVCVLPQCGQGVCTTDCGRKVRRSNVVPHFSHVYSKIGISHSSCVSGYFPVYPYQLSVPSWKAHFHPELGASHAAYFSDTWRCGRRYDRDATSSRCLTPGIS